jgi:hypothetical protein
MARGRATQEELGTNRDQETANCNDDGEEKLGKETHERERERERNLVQQEVVRAVAPGQDARGACGEGGGRRNGEENRRIVQRKWRWRRCSTALKLPSWRMLINESACVLSVCVYLRITDFVKELKMDFFWLSDKRNKKQTRKTRENKNPHVIKSSLCVCVYNHVINAYLQGLISGKRPRQFRVIWVNRLMLIEY